MMNKKFLLVSIISLTTLSLFSQERMTLDNLIARLLEKNYALQIADKRVQQAENNVTLSPMMPTISANARQAYTNVQSPKTNTFGLGASINWRLFDGFGMFATYQKQKEQLDLWNLYKLEDVEDLVRQVKTQYYLIVSLNSRAKVARELVNLSRRIYDEALLRYSLEALSGLEMKLAKTDLNADSTYLMRQLEAVDVAYVNLNKLLNFDHSLRGYVQDSIAVGAELSKEEIEKMLLACNTQILVADKGVDVADLNLRLAKASAYPTLDFSAGYNYNAVTELPAYNHKNSKGYNFGFTLGVKLFDGLNIQRNISNSRIDQSISQITKENVINNVLASFNNQYVNYDNNYRLIDFETENAEAMRLNLEVATERYRLGELSGLDFRIIQQQYLSAEDRKINALYLAKMSEIALQTLAGTVVDMDLNKAGL